MTRRTDRATTAQGSPITLPGHVFESADPAIVTIDAAGLVTARSVGTTTVAVRVNEQRARSTIVVLPIVRTVTVTAPATQHLVGDSVVLTAKVLGWAGETLIGQPITYSSSSPSATVSPTGVVRFAGTGAATITATSGASSATVTLTAFAREFIGGASGSISSGMDATCGLLPLGRTFCFGKAPVTGIARDTSCFDVPGTPGDPKPCSLVPLQIAGQLQLTAVAVGDSVACGLNAAGRAYCWGDQKYGQVGNGVSKEGASVLPVPVTGPFVAALTFTQIAAGHTHACALTATGAAYCWGNDITFQSGGNGDTLNVSSSTPIPAGAGVTYRAITAGHGHTCGLRTDGIAMCWGDNRRGQLGRGAVGAPNDSALAVAGPAFTQISAGGDNTCGLTAAGTIYCWGANSHRQTGQAVGDSVPTPASVGGTGYASIAVGRDHACASSGGAVSCWGSNQYGQLGRGFALGAFPNPAPVLGGRTYSVLSSGTRTSCAVASDGAYCWGSSIYGAAGNQIQASAVVFPQKTAPPQ